MLWRIVILAVLLGIAEHSVAQENRYPALVQFFEEWRAFETPPRLDGAPDYTAPTIARRQQTLREFQKRLAAIDATSWPVEQRVDYEVVRAEMNGLDFHLRVLRAFERDPAFYVTVWTAQTDTPAREGPTHHAPLELWTYSFPLSGSEEQRLTTQLRVIPPLLKQARANLTGNARDLWIAGASSIQQQAKDLAALEKKVAKNGGELRGAVQAAYAATTELAAWLDAQASTKTGPSGVGKENYTWNLRNVHLVPLSWEDEVAIFKRELARAHASLRLEEQRNRGLPELHVTSSPEDYQKRGHDAVTKYVAFLKDNNILPIHSYTDSAVRAQIGEFVPEEKRNFFAMATHREPMTLYTHYYHWWDLAQMRESPHASPIRRGPLLFNIWDSRAEGMATAFEEMMLHTGLYDDNPRAREIVWIMLAQRAARGLGSLYAQANEFTMKQAADFHVQWTPRGWMRPDLDLLGFEQQLYLRQPGYGTSYLTGKHLLEQLMADRSRQLGKAFSLSKFYDEVNAAGLIPVSLIRWQLTGLHDGIDAPATH